MRTTRAAPLRLAGRGTDGLLQLHRRLLQFYPAPFSPGVSLAHLLRTGDANRAATRQPLNRPRKRGNFNPALASEPGEGSFDDPAVPSQTLGAVDAASRDARLDGAPTQRPAAMREIVALIGMELGRSLLRSADTVAYRRHAIDHRLKELAVVAVGRAEPDREWNTIAVG